MPLSNPNPPTWVITNGWREILTRIFAEVETQYNVTPDWLINPTTKRHLKLDVLYPGLGLAVRFEGAEVKQRRRLSLEEEAQFQVRTDARFEVCRVHGIELVLIDVSGETPQTTFQALDLALSRVSQQIKTPQLRQQVSQARTTAASLSRQVSSYANFKLYADLWDDRQYHPTISTRVASGPANNLTFTIGLEVEHTAFGPGVVTAMASSGSDTLITVDFITAGVKTLAASLVGDKLRPRKI
jgi:hypothetical protein